MAEVVVSSTASTSPPAICSAGESFAVLWNDTTNTRILGRMLELNGDLTGAEFRIADAGNTNVFPAAALRPGGFAVVWLTDTPRRNLMFQALGPTGKKIGEARQVNTNDVNMEFPPAIVRMANQNLVVVWTDANESVGVRAQILKPDGTDVGGEFGINESDGIHFGPIRLTTPPNIGFVVAWKGGPAIGMQQALLRTFDQDGTPSSGEIVADISGFQGDMALTFISDDSGAGVRFVLAHVAAHQPERTIVGTLFKPDGIVDHAFNITHRSDHTIAHSVSLVAQPNFMFAACWVEHKVPEFDDRTGENVMVMRCREGADGLEPIRDAERLSDQAAGNQTFPRGAFCLTSLGLAKLGFVWIDDLGRPELNSRTVKARITS